MTWDTTAEQVTIKALGTVEASMNYGATNPTDPISIGLFQWYGTRAANLLFEIQSSDPTDFSAYCPATISSAMGSHPATDSYWNTRYLSNTERSGLYDLLTQPSVVTIQDNQIVTDLADYVAAFQSAGGDKDANTETLEMFCVAYNQSPVQALADLSNAGADASMHTLYLTILNDPILGQYQNRYNEAYTIILAQDTSGVGSIGSSVAPTQGNGSGSTGGSGTGSSSSQGTNTTSAVGQLSFYTSPRRMTLQNKNAHTTYVPIGKRTWGIANDATLPPPAPTPTEGGTGGSTPSPGAADAIIAWENSVIGDYTYSQGSGRLNPVASGHTDCSGFQYYAFLTYGGINIGTWTGQQITKGTLISTNPAFIEDISNLQKADLVFIRWGPDSPSTYDHVESFDGGTNRISMGTTPGPDTYPWSTDLTTAVAAGGSLMLRRYL